MGTVFAPHAEILARFADLKPALTPQAATVEANRCLNCFDAPCTAACPTHIDVPRFIKKIASGNVTGSAKSILEANVLAGSCARVCPVEVLCEGSCVMHHRDEKPIMIGQLQRFAMDNFYDRGLKIPLRSRPELPLKVACVGGGPASLACAAELRQHGVQVTIFDKRDLAGGLNTYGVAEYKLRVTDSLREVEAIRDLGVQIEQREVCADDFAALEAEFDAVFLGVGLGEMHRLRIPGGETGVMDALDLIARYKTGELLAVGNSVAVIGCGNTAIDAAVAAKRLGAEEVHIVYRRGQEEMSAFGFEYEHALKEGVKFLWWRQPIELQAGMLLCATTSINEAGELVLSETRVELPAEVVVPAIGQSPLSEWLSLVKGLEFAKGRVLIDRATGATSHSKYFAGGDCANGGREVVDAVADGKRAARGIVATLGITEVAHG
ncbi:FAD-dependent oxidoreductase [Terriglobus tenax]|uniref:FAD-dependent oxidoreductase n=1 Tax=Terriglobus tenax TaxID=1111115 RepID=UPI0021DFC746|nr:FAD-dependent oxidoreductase [Terriglobus tenax]